MWLIQQNKIYSFLIKGFPNAIHGIQPTMIFSCITIVKQELADSNNPWRKGPCITHLRSLLTSRNSQNYPCYVICIACKSMSSFRRSSKKSLQSYPWKTICNCVQYFLWLSSYVVLSHKCNEQMMKYHNSWSVAQYWKLKSIIFIKRYEIYWK